jgi:hypothetical protein
MNAVVVTFAHHRARQKVKEQLKAAGHKLYQYKARDILVMARMYEELHREELTAEAMRTI